MANLGLIHKRILIQNPQDHKIFIYNDNQKNFTKANILEYSITDIRLEDQNKKQFLPESQGLKKTVKESLLNLH